MANTSLSVTETIDQQCAFLNKDDYYVQEVIIHFFELEI